MSSKIEKLSEDFVYEIDNDKSNCDWFSDIDRLFNMSDIEIMENIHAFDSLNKEYDIEKIIDAYY